MVVAPATANIIAKMAGGIGDDLLSTTLIAARSPVVVAPTMNSRMYLNPVTQENLRKIREIGAIVVDPSEGSLACRTEGVGRMAEPAEIMAVIERELTLRAGLSGKRILVTAGPTREHIDPVRFLSNPSTGLMGYAVADRASRRGAVVTLVSGPVELLCPAGVERVEVVSAAEMKDAVVERLPENDALVMAAAVADYTVSSPSPAKVKKSGGIPELELKATDDILKSVAPLKDGRIVVGFAAETDRVVENALVKLADKDLDLIVANQVAMPGSGFGASTDFAAVISRGEQTAELELMSKTELADLLLDRLCGLFEE
jgi:phosphopantothenoylcysteine decarboxylase/phosphopantothenate--cysteine ligase